MLVVLVVLDCVMLSNSSSLTEEADECESALLLALPHDFCSLFDGWLFRLTCSAVVEVVIVGVVEVVLVEFGFGLLHRSNSMSDMRSLSNWFMYRRLPFRRVRTVGSEHSWLLPLMASPLLLYKDDDGPYPP